MNMSMLSVGNLDNKIISSSVQVASKPQEHDKKTVLFCCTGSAAARGWHPAPVQAPCRADWSCLHGY